MKYLVRSGLALIALVALFVGDQFLDSENSSDEIETALPNAALPADTDSVVDSAWFCPSGTRSADGVADQSVQIANLSADESATAVATVLTGTGRGASREVQIAPGESAVVDAAELDPPSEEDEDDLAGMVVRITRGTAVVSHSNVTSSGIAYGACGTQAAEEWHFASGRRIGEGREYITLMNPFDEDVSVDILPQTPGVPVIIDNDFEGLTLFGNSVIQIEINDEDGFENVDQIPITIRSRGGRIVAERLQLIDEDLTALIDELEEDLAGEETEDEAAETEEEEADAEVDAEGVEELAEEDEDLAVTGASLQLGASSPQDEWLFTAGRVNEDTTHLVTIYNPRLSDSRVGLGSDFLEDLDSGSPQEIAEAVIDEVDIDFDVPLDSEFFESLESDNPQVVSNAVLREINGRLLLEDTAQIRIEVWPTNTGLRENIFVPIEREVSPLSVSVVDLVAESRRLGFVLPVDFSVEVISQNQIPVLAERWQFAERVSNSSEIAVGDILSEPEPEVGDVQEILPADVDDTSPGSASVGLMTSRGIDFDPVESWVVPWTPVFSESSSWVTVFAPTNGTQITVLDAIGGEPIAPANGAEIANPHVTAVDGERWFFPIPDDGSGGGALVINASRPVAVEAQAISPDSSDILPAIPLIDS